VPRVNRGARWNRDQSESHDQREIHYRRENERQSRGGHESRFQRSSHVPRVNRGARSNRDQSESHDQREIHYRRENERQSRGGHESRFQRSSHVPRVNHVESDCQSQRCCRYLNATCSIWHYRCPIQCCPIRIPSRCFDDAFPIQSRWSPWKDGVLAHELNQIQKQNQIQIQTQLRYCAPKPSILLSALS
jgi:hypothetical protein